MGPFACTDLGNKDDEPISQSRPAEEHLAGESHRACNYSGAMFNGPRGARRFQLGQGVMQGSPHMYIRMFVMCAPRCLQPGNTSNYIHISINHPL